MSILKKDDIFHFTVARANRKREKQTLNVNSACAVQSTLPKTDTCTMRPS